MENGKWNKRSAQKCSLKLSIHLIYQQVKFTRPLTLEDFGSPVLLTVFHQLIGPTGSEKATD